MSQKEFQRVKVIENAAANWRISEDRQNPGEAPSAEPRASGTKRKPGYQLFHNGPLNAMGQHLLSTGSQADCEAGWVTNTQPRIQSIRLWAFPSVCRVRAHVEVRSFDVFVRSDVWFGIALIQHKVAQRYRETYQPGVDEFGVLLQ